MNASKAGFGFPEVVLPYIKNQDIFICPSAPRTVGAYGNPCGTNSKVVSTYIYPSWLRYTYWLWFNGQAEFAGFPDPNSTDCPNASPTSTGSMHGLSGTNSVVSPYKHSGLITSRIRRATCRADFPVPAASRRLTG